MTEITIDINTVLSLPDNSIKNPDIIRQITIYDLENRNDIGRQMRRKINSDFSYAGLYPYSIKISNVKPETSVSALTAKKIYEDIKKLIYVDIPTSNNDIHHDIINELLDIKKRLKNISLKIQK